MRLSEVNEIRAAVAYATDDAENVETLLGLPGWIYTPVFWVGTHLNPRIVKVFRNTGAIPCPTSSYRTRVG